MPRFPRLLFCCALLCFASLEIVYAQSARVRGFVTDSLSQKALQGASVTVRNTQGAFFGSATDGDGYFILGRIPAGRYTFQISFIGFAPYTETLTLTPGDVIARRVALAPASTEIDEVVVEAEGESGVTAVSAGLQTVEPAQIERTLMPGVTGDLASYLQTVPGVVAQGDRGGQLFVRGGALDQNLAFIDGIPLYMPFHIVGFYSAFPEEIIDNANLYTGGFGARYGTRISSMIDVHARNGNKQNFAGSASISPFLTTARIEGPIVPDRVSFIGSFRESLVKRAMPDLFGQKFPYRFGDQFGKLHAFLGSGTSLSVTALHTFDRGDLAGSSKTFEGDAQSSVLTDSTNLAWNNLAYGGRFVHLSNRLPVLAEFVAGYAETENAFGPPEAAERTSDLQSLDLAAHFTYFLSAGDLKFGATRRRSEMRYALDGQLQDLETNEAELTELDAYLATELQWGNVSVEPGVHFYHLQERGAQGFEPRLRASWNPGFLEERLRLHAAGGVYHQAIVGLNDRRDVGNVFTAWLPAPEADPLPEATHAIVGASMQIQPWLSVATEGFYKSFSNLSAPFFTAFPRFNTRLQPADGHAEGFDLRVDFKERPFSYESVLDGYVTYALTNVTYETPQATYNPAHDRRHQINAVLHAQRGEVGITLQWQYGSGLPFTPSGGFDRWFLFTQDVDVTQDQGQIRVLYGEPFSRRQPSYQRLDVWLEHRFEEGRVVGTLRAGAVNLFNRKNLFYFDLFTLQRVDQLPLIPSVGIKLEVR